MLQLLSALAKKAIPLPTPEIEIKARLAKRIADAVSDLGLSTHHINACVWDGLDCFTCGYSLEKSFTHALALAELLKPFTNAGDDHEQSIKQ